MAYILAFILIRNSVQGLIFLELLTLYIVAKSLISKCIDQAVGLPHSIARASMVLSSEPIKQIKTVRESSAGYDFSVIAYNATSISHY